jgi:hypothetical protein
MTDPQAADRVDRLLDAIELLRDERRDEAFRILRDLIREDNDFEAAWLWMSVTVESLDQSSICLDNVLRVNPHNVDAAGALSRIRGPELLHERRRARLRFWRDVSLGAMWMLVIALLYAMLWSYVRL